MQARRKIYCECSDCGEMYDIDWLVKYQGKLYCPECKPQKEKKHQKGNKNEIERE